MSTITNPLELQEIISRVGWFIPLWVARPCNPDADLDFTPAQLAACTRVSHLWRTSLTPILWRVYDWYRCARVPWTSLAPNLHHLRYVHLSLPWELDMVPARLKTLYLYSEAVQASQLLHANSHIAELTWNSGCCKDHDPSSQSALEALSQLQICHLRYYHFKVPENLDRILGNNPDLQKLTLFHVKGISEEYQYRSLENLTLLRLQVDWLQNHCLVHLVRFCPRLETFEYEAAIACPTFLLAQNLRKYCPVLHTLRRLDYQLYDPGNLQEDVAELEVLALLQASRPGGLKVLEMALLTLTDRIFLDLLGRHGQALEKVELRLQRVNAENVRNVARLLRSCPRLVSLNVQHIRPHGVTLGGLEGFPPGESMCFLDVDETWCCSNTLESIQLRGFTPDCTMEEGSTDVWVIPRIDGLPDRHSDKDREFLVNIANHSWTYKAVPVVAEDGDVRLNSIPQDLRDVRQIVFDRVVRWPQMRRVVVENLEYVKIQDDKER